MYNLATMLHFQHSEYFLIALVLGLMVFFFVRLLKWKRGVIKSIGDVHLVRALIGEFSPRKFRLKFVLFSIAFLFIVVALASLVKPDVSGKIQRHGTDIIIALDVSKSMLATDVKPNRLERARQFIYKVIENSPNDRIGIVLFAGRAYLQMPLTLDHSAARMYVSAISTNDIPTQGTVIHRALQMSGAAFGPNDKTYQSILLITDGEDHDENAVKEAKELAKQGVIVNTVGVGSAEGSPIPDGEGGFKVNQEGTTVISRLNEEELVEIANAGNGVYMPFSQPAVMAEELAASLRDERRESIVTGASFSSYTHYFQYFLALSLLLLLVEMLVSEKRKIRKAATVLLLCLLVQGPAMAQDKLREGNRAFIENRFDEAEKAYREMVHQDGQDAVAAYNLGNTLYRQDKAAEAAGVYDQAIAATKDEGLKQKAFYNQGVAYHKAGDLQKCIVSYKNALLLDPQDEQARQNLQKALKQQQQQQENQKDKKKQQENQPEKKKEQQQQQNEPNKEKNEKNQRSKPKISREEAEEKLKALLEKEKQLQEQFKKMRGAEAHPPEKDW